MRETNQVRNAKIARGRRATAVFLALAAALAAAESAPQLARVKDVATIEGIRDEKQDGEKPT